ncbi:MAG: VCBS repeat-containing protein, partial [Polyangiales bacterium]
MTSRRTQQRPTATRILAMGALLALWAVGCSEPPAVTPDAARKDAVTEAGDSAVDVTLADARPDRTDASLDRADAPRPDAAPDAAHDVPMDLVRPDLEYIDLGPFVADEDVPASYDVNLDRSWDVARPDVTFRFMEVAALFPDVPPPDRPFPPCTPGAIESCACPDGRSGFQTCEYDYNYSTCACADPPPVIATPRLVAPLSGMRVSSQRPTLRWQLPAGMTRARVELCTDRSCTRPLAQEEVTGSSWRSPTRLAPGLTFWRVRGLDAAGAVAWTSATWLFQVRRRDTEVDTTLGRILDFNGDGYDDLPMPRLVDGDPLRGRVVDVFFGTPDGLTPEPLLTVQLPEAELAGSFRIRSFSAGDMDGDGNTDLLMYVVGSAGSSGPLMMLYGYRGERLRPLGRRSWRMQLPIDFSYLSADFP